ncbi:hypothetical protein AWC05_24810 [Mycobacterium florentinum]|uniref:PPE domain-containing protein n=2 Tax=Mycobacterium florentinum TaxID=292462 RepID=A0A1X1U7W5_MYCFL|nr:hypothetical protein AWC05_24810 [Mycobacterium florentinum]
MHSGPGAESLMAAAAAWDEVADRLDDAAAGYEAVPAQIPDPYVAWLKYTATQARQAAIQATAATTAHSSARTAVAPPEAVEFNRQQRMSLATTNHLGHASAVLAEIEADYERIWAQNADAMFTYARSSAEISMLTPFSSPPLATDSTVPVVISTGHQVMSAIPEALRAIFLAPRTTFDVYLSPVTISLSQLSCLSAPRDFALNYLNYLNKTAAVNKAAAMWQLSSPVRRAAPGTGFGHAVAIGTLSVPPGWVRQESAWPDPQAGPLDQLQ